MHSPQPQQPKVNYQSETDRIHIKGWLDKLARWLEKQPITAGGQLMEAVTYGRYDNDHLAIIM